MKKIKLAICISGEPRLYLRLAKHINYFDKNIFDIDVFYHLWDNVTKRQKDINEEPIMENIHSAEMENVFKPKVGVCESKDVLEQELSSIKKYTENLVQEYTKDKKHKVNEYYNVLTNSEKLNKQLKFTNWPWYSQLYSLCKSQMIRIDYEIKKYGTKANGLLDSVEFILERKF